MTQEQIGSDPWWAEKRGPEWQPEGADYRVTFWWRDPEGTQNRSSIQRVWLYITGVTDHHHDTPPQSMQRIAGTDVWHWETLLPSDWRGSYCFIPSTRTTDFSPEGQQDAQPSKLAIRQGWKTLLPQAIADPLNPVTWRGGRGHPFSGLSLPEAPLQPGWDDKQAHYSVPDSQLWHSRRLGNSRRVWLYETGESQDKDRPLAILLDGQFWAESMPIWQPLAALTATGQLPAAVYLLIDVIDDAHRNRELPCCANFWQALQDELLPTLRAQVAFSDNPAQTVVAGQSFGGLSALYAGIHWPERFGCVLSQSGSFWWPDRQAAHQGQLISDLSQDSTRVRGLRIILQAGRREPLILAVNQRLYPLLAQAKQRRWWEVEGGHDALCWRGGLTAGLIALWQPLTQN